mgnify:CR=1 FL=1
MHTLLNVTLKTLITLEGVNAPNTLDFSVSKQWLPVQMYTRARALVTDEERYILKGLPQVTGEEEEVYYVLSMSQKAYPKISHNLVARCVHMP